MNSLTSDKLCGIAVAVGVIGLNTLGLSTALGVLEAATGAGGFLLGRQQGRDADFRRVLVGVKREVERDYRAWIEAEHGGKSWFHKANLDNAIAELERVIEHCVPDPSDIVGVNLNGGKLADLLLARAAQHSPAFRESGDNPAARGIFRTIVANTFERARTNAEYAATLRTYIDEELLARTGRTEAVVTRTERKVDAARDKLDAILAKVSADKGVPLPVLQEILAQLGERDVPLDATVIEARLRAKADEYHELTARLRRLAGDDERVQELRREAAALIDRGDFGGADARLAEAEARDLEVVQLSS